MPASASVGELRHGRSGRPHGRSGRDLSRARVQVSEMQRSRLLSAAVATIAELGWSGATVAHITARARVSRRTFYDLFDNREDCLLAVLEDVVGELERELAAADLGGLSWGERVRGGLWRILCFFDREPELARVCVAQALHGGPRVLAWREEILARLAGVLDEGRRHSGDGVRECPPLTAEGLVGGTFSIVYARLTRGGREPLAGLLGELMGMIVLPYQGPAAARREQSLSVPAPPLKPRAARHESHRVMSEDDPLRGVPMRLTYRTARVLEDVAAHPGASNRVIGDLSGISDQGQVSKLLARLERLGLLENVAAGHARGERNAWRLTERGAQVTQTISAHTEDEKGEAAQ